MFSMLFKSQSALILPSTLCIRCIFQATGPQLGGLFNALANIGVGIIIAFVYSWVLTLAILAFAPFMAIAGFVEMKVFRGGGTKNKELFEEAGKVRVPFECGAC